MTVSKKVVLVRKLPTTVLANMDLLSGEIDIGSLVVPMLADHWWRQDESKIDANADGVFVVLVFDKKDQPASDERQ